MAWALNPQGGRESGKSVWPQKIMMNMTFISRSSRTLRKGWRRIFTANAGPHRKRFRAGKDSHR